jgi:hypothetical protein
VHLRADALFVSYTRNKNSLASWDICLFNSMPGSILSPSEVGEPLRQDNRYTEHDNDLLNRVGNHLEPWTTRFALRRYLCSERVITHGRRIN